MHDSAVNASPIVHMLSEAAASSTSDTAAPVISRPKQAVPAERTAFSVFLRQHQANFGRDMCYGQQHGARQQFDGSAHGTVLAAWRPCHEVCATSWTPPLLVRLLDDLASES